ncbi:LIC_10705 family lipoprotein [Leptospira harrisiae]|uniref:LIC_10705 family lipoprotein n=1 Tax=Leptospira harrisiae TaxID=2023189 RepID=UPI001A9CB4BA|nr:LIC_10705 family lipoprotein [Leptospira harrisiae]
MKTILVILLCTYTFFGCYADSKNGYTYGIPSDQLSTYLFFFVVPNLDFNQFCPPTEQIPILEPGTYNRYMAAGDSFIFDNRARFTQTAPAGETRIFTFTIQESPGQNIKLTSPACGDSSFEAPSKGDSGLSSQLETIYIGLRTPPFPAKRTFFFTKLTSISGSGNISITTPTSADPENAH